MHLLPYPPAVWALKPPSWALHLLGLSLAKICVCTRRYAGMQMYSIMLVCKLRPLQGGLEFLGSVKWHSPIGSMPFHRTQNSLGFQGPTPSHLPS
jgi:hypothetical protein